MTYTLALILIWGLLGTCWAITVAMLIAHRRRERRPWRDE